MDVHLPTVCALKHQSIVCCIRKQTVNAIMGQTNFNGVLQCSMSIKDNEAFHIHLYILFYCIYRLQISISGAANGQPKYSSTVCAQMFGCQFVHKCTSAQIVHAVIRWPIYRSTVCAQTDSKRSTEIFVNRLTSAIFCCVVRITAVGMYFFGIECFVTSFWHIATEVPGNNTD